MSKAHVITFRNPHKDRCSSETKAYLDGGLALDYCTVSVDVQNDLFDDE